MSATPYHVHVRYTVWADSPDDAAARILGDDTHRPHTSRARRIRHPIVRCVRERASARVLVLAEPGLRVRLLHTSDEHTALRPGAEGVVQLIDDLGTVHVAWAEGGSLGLVPGIDRWEVVDEP